MFSNITFDNNHLIKDVKLDIPDNVKEIIISTTPGLNKVENIDKIMSDLFELSLKLINPRGVFQVSKIIKLTSKSIILNNGAILNGNNISTLLRGSDYTVLYCLTLGDKIDREIDELQKSGKMMECFILSAIGIFEIHLATKKIKEVIYKQLTLNDNYDKTCSYSPGNSGWNLEDQKIIMGLLDSQKINITLNDNYTMVPLKSVNGAFGIGRKNAIFAHSSACHLCGQKDCLYKKVEDILK